MEKSWRYAIVLSGLLLAGMGQGQAIAAPKDVADAAPASVQPEKTPGQPGTVSEEKVSINHASAAELASVLNGVGLRKAEAIIRYREQYGPFTAVEQLSEVPGIGKALLKRNLPNLKL
ncbi:hypothetical protein BL250_04455 [Erwinia sp. OLTSP20]|uniref:ComEA family DNA-binding protein n=1 Tax=unclassified Erwinia TaxID=2622719 RepID=UPI000C194F0F|nr:MULTISPECIES: helix-hairpin-helix domain-containing protein [unclassified Erwinia]PIJ52223.1 hypothetical protein BV501_00430 [Erwinia sp. OAMSP11]PIJ75734.1 hypothetical protein BK416_01090 [Erwinia sp. OLSSP12]PIJ81141.1 hypothetical protein BLD46_13160 [Erwinia sp. OLMTSP26]PIJ84230.1 hypothetical protein BLD47_02475 [Erwinia sp. OLCASP19]PIJ88695.1 hypothetical protein BLD49_00785 [Erwinia sp. OLMDSP33]